MKVFFISSFGTLVLLVHIVGALAPPQVHLDASQGNPEGIEGFTP